jgi:hypothetical protein
MVGPICYFISNGTTGQIGLSISQLLKCQVFRGLNKALYRMHRSSWHSIDLWEVEYTLIDRSGPEWTSSSPNFLSGWLFKVEAGAEGVSVKGASLLWLTVSTDRRMLYNLFLTVNILPITHSVIIACMRFIPYVWSFKYCVSQKVIWGWVPHPQCIH